MEDDNHVASPESDSVAACRGSLRVETLNPVNILNTDVMFVQSQRKASVEALRK